MLRLGWVRALLLICLCCSACVPPPPALPELTATATAAATAAASVIPAAAATATLSPTATPSGPTVTPAGAWIQLSPDAGLPGDTVQVEGYLPGGPAPDYLQGQDYLTHADFCWGGCLTGLMENGQEVKWSRTEPGRFTMQLIIPPIPWLANDGVHLLEAGDYTVDLINLDPSKYGCADPGANGCPIKPYASATFHLTQSAPHPAGCTGQTCGSLTASPARARPGELVQVSGWAPLRQLTGVPFGFDLALAPTQDFAAAQNNILIFPIQQALDGSFSGSFQVPQIGFNGQPLAPGSYTLALSGGGTTNEKGGPLLLINPTPFEIAPALAWSQVPHPSPLWFQPSASLQADGLSVDPLNPDRLAYCAPGVIRVSKNAGQSWTEISTRAVAKLVPDESLKGGEDLPLCAYVVLDSAHPDSYYAVFSLVSKLYGPPPVYLAGYFTRDAGKTWQLAPVPSVIVNQQMAAPNFGGLWTNGPVVQAMYYWESSTPPATNMPGQPQPPLLKQTSDGGASWSPAPMACATSGPCLHWGGAPSIAWSMGGDLNQGVWASFDQGATWEYTGQSASLREPGAHQLVALSTGEALLISGSDGFPLRYTADGGRTWQAVSLPPLPGAARDGYSGYPGLELLPNGALIAMRSDTGQWMGLPPDGQDWCPLDYTSPNSVAQTFQPAGQRLWWLDETTARAQSAPIERFTCGH